MRISNTRTTFITLGCERAMSAARAADIARSQPSVMKVVRVFEILTEDQLSNLK